MVFKRIFKVFQSEAHSVVDKLEDPIKMTEQGIRDLKKDLQGAMTSLAEVKSLSMRLGRDVQEKKQLGSDYERKAMLLLQKAQSGGIAPEEADRLAGQALQRKEQTDTELQRLQTDYEAQTKMADSLQGKVGQIKQAITRYENELVTLKARARTASSMRKINQQLSTIDASGTISMLEKMKQKVDEEESLAAAYGEISTMDNGVDSEIDKALESPTPAASDSLLELKQKMGLLNNNP